MVDSIQSSQIAKLRVLSGQQQAATPATATPNKAEFTTKMAEKITSLDSSVTTVVSELKQKGPPFDTEKVSRIKEAVAQGTYPINREALSDKMFQSFQSFARQQG